MAPLFDIILRFIVMATMTAFFFRPAAAETPSCYRAVGAAPPQPTGVTIAVVDRTTLADPAAVKSLNALVAKILRRPGERVLVASFAGMAPGQFPTVHADVVQEPDPPPALIESSTLKRTADLHACLRKLRPQNTQAVLHALRALLGKDLASPYSEIVAGLRWAMVDLAPRLFGTEGTQRVRVLMYSDGDLNSLAGVTFYRNGKPREIDAAIELAKVTQAEQRRLPPTLRPVEVWWVGLGLQTPGHAYYMTPRALDERRVFWTGVARLFGAREVSIGLALPDDRF